MNVLCWTLALVVAIGIHTGVTVVFWALNGAHFSLLRPFIRCILAGGLYQTGIQILGAIFSHLQGSKRPLNAYWKVSGCLFKILIATWVFLTLPEPIIAWLAFMTTEIASLFCQFRPWNYSQRYRKFLTMYDVFNPPFDEESRHRLLYGAINVRLFSVSESKRPIEDSKSITETLKSQTDDPREDTNSKNYKFYTSTTDNIHSIPLNIDSNHLNHSSDSLNIHSNTTNNTSITLEPSELSLKFNWPMLQSPTDFNNLRKLQSMPILRKYSQENMYLPLSISPKAELPTPWSWTSLEKSTGPEKPKIIRKKLSTFTLTFEPKDISIGETLDSILDRRTCVSSGDETTSLLSQNTTLHNSIQSETHCTHNNKHFSNFTQYYLDSCADYPIDPYFLKFGKLQREFSGVEFALYVSARLAALYSIVFSTLWMKLFFALVIAAQSLIPLEKATVFLVYDLSLSAAVLCLGIVVSFL